MSSAASTPNTNFTSFENFSTNVQAFVPRTMDTVVHHAAFAKQGSFTPTHQMIYNSPIAKQCYAAPAANKAIGGFSDYSSHMQAVMAQSDNHSNK